MTLRSILVITLSAPAATLVVFLGFIVFARASFVLSDLVRETSNGAGNRVTAVPRMLSLKARRIVLRTRWRQSRTGWFVHVLSDLTGPFARTVYSRTVWMLCVGFVASVVVCSPRLAGPLIQGREVSAAALFPPAVVLGTLLGVVSLLRAMSYSVRAYRDPVTGSLPRFVFPVGEVALARRVEFQRRVYLWSQLRFCAGASGMIGVLNTLIAYGATTASPAPPRSPAAAQFTTQDLVDLLWMASFVLVWLVVTIVKWAVDRSMPSTVAAVLAHRCIHLDTQHSPIRRWGVVDPLGRRRAHLARTSRTLTAAARRVDIVSGDHPIGSVLHGCARRLRLFLARTDSLAPSYPPEVTQVLRDVIIIVAGPATLRLHAEIASRIDAFDSEGAPLPVLRATRSTWLSRAARSAADSLETYSRFSTSFWSVATLIIVVVLIATGRLDITSFELQK
ncbi:hypothetical protein [Lentzea sp. HUAS12]|uniref:hypothetical protein n=1 Tax=Lentzea sp. HUAS12 TaxID=2951806 RepID=UPI0020A02BE2|nr:hypothetical protein [Lentzea sp. HUAS12]USX54109.1 hypothetical protein ND450_08415 [Lentzea sp. HUAS12]